MSNDQSEALKALLPTLETDLAKRLLEKAISVWEVFPVRRAQFGLTIKNNKIVPRDYVTGGCLLATNMIGKSETEENFLSWWKTAQNVLSISEDEVRSIVRIFDEGFEESPQNSLERDIDKIQRVFFKKSRMDLLIEATREQRARVKEKRAKKLLEKSLQ